MTTKDKFDELIASAEKSVQWAEESLEEAKIKLLSLRNEKERWFPNADNDS
jgi:hypothetical protein